MLCYQPMLSSHAITPCYHPMSPSHAIILSYVHTFSYHVITPRYHLKYHPSYHHMLSPHVIMPGDNCILKTCFSQNNKAHISRAVGEVPEDLSGVEPGDNNQLHVASLMC
jgi:hypothetical protein